MPELIAQALNFLKGLIGFGEKIQDEKNTPAMLGQKQANQQIGKKTEIANDDKKAADTGDDSDFEKGL